MSSHGRIVHIFGDTIKHYLGIDGKFLAVVLIGMQTSKFALSTLKITGEKTYPLGFGFIGSILVLAANGSLIVTKIGAMSIWLLTMPYLYYPVIVMELIGASSAF